MPWVIEMLRAPKPAATESTAFDFVMAHGVRLIWAVILTYGVFIAMVAVGEPRAPGETPGVLPNLYDKPLQEDGFYGLTIAWNIAHGHGAAVNYGSATTGFHPLATAVLFPILAKLTASLGLGKVEFARVVLAFGTLNLIALSHLLGLVAAALTPKQEYRRTSYVVSAAVACCSFHLYRTCSSGMETGVYLSCIALVVLASIRLFGRTDGVTDWTWGNAAVFGTLVGLTGLARIDFGIVFAVFLGLLVALRRTTLPSALKTGVVALIVVAPWFLWVHQVSGAWMPSSGTVETELIGTTTAPISPGVATRTRAILEAIVDNAAPWFLAGALPFGRAIQILSLLLLIWVCRKNTESNSSPALIYLWGAGVGALACVYFLFFWTFFFYNRFLSPLVVITIPLAVALTVPKLVKYAQGAQALGLFLLPPLFLAFAVLSLHDREPPPHLAQTARYIRDYIPSSTKVGAFQSGIVGYVNSNVVNLDGKVNSDALLYHERHAVNEYIDQQGVNVIADWHWIIRRHLDDEYLETYWKPCQPELALDLDSICLQRKSGN